ncbi:CaiB/BaiF CoA transferase family protein [Sneathiella chinensis]|nr:CoA transferase [Sneathiella chinensis]
MTSTLPLSGIRVVEMSHMVMGPSCGMILAQLGAEVIKVEPPKGDKTRDLRGMGTSFFPLFNRGKKSVVLDLSLTEDREAFYALLETADVFVENFKDGMLATYGADAETLREKFPRLIVAGHKGFLSGPYEHRPALDEVVQMMGGLAMMTGSRERPLRVGSSANDIMGGMFGVIGILCALLERGNSGEGKNVRVGLFENCLLMVAQHMVQYDMTGVPSTPMPARTHAWPVYDIFDTRDGQRVFVGVVTDGHWQTFCRTYGLENLLQDERLQTATDRIEARSWTIPLVAEKLALVDAGDLMSRLDELSIPFAPINAPEDLYQDPHVQRDGGLVTSTNTDGQTFRAPALPLEMDGANVVGELDVPKLGADTDRILADLGIKRSGNA